MVADEIYSLAAFGGRAVDDIGHGPVMSDHVQIYRRELIQGVAQVSDEDTLIKIVDEVLAANPEQVSRFREGKETLLQWFVGQVMQQTQGKANPKIVNELLRKKLAK